MQAAVTQAAQERRPEHLVFAVTHIDPEHFAVTVGGHGGGHDDGRDTIRWLPRALM